MPNIIPPIVSSSPPPLDPLDDDNDEDDNDDDFGDFTGADFGSHIGLFLSLQGHLKMMVSYLWQFV